jgi:hypothetical protein
VWSEDNDIMRHRVELVRLRAIAGLEGRAANMGNRHRLVAGMRGWWERSGSERAVDVRASAEEGERENEKLKRNKKKNNREKGVGRPVGRFGLL